MKDVNQRFKTRFLMDNVDEQIDVVSRSILGLTVSCARCHDHKFDPIPVTDYYAMAGIFASTDDAAGVRNKMGGGGLDYYDPAMLVRLTGEAPPAPPEEVAKLEAQVAEAKKAWDNIRGTPEGLKKAADGKPTQRPFRLKYEDLQGRLRSLTDPAEHGLVVHGVREGKTIGDTEVRIRGEAERIGPTVPRGFLSVVSVPDAPAVNPHQSGRLELAEWLTSPQNPLTARVIVNRVWEHLFGTGLVSTVDNFGVKGDVPSNPELLDYLAQEFIHDGWSVKKLVRSLTLTRAYQLGSDAPDQNKEVDPANRLVWRHSPRRLSAEELRDTMLAVAGRLDATHAEASPAKDLRMVEMRDNGPEALRITVAADSSLHRSVYLPLLRGVTPKALEAFDPVSQTLVSRRAGKHHRAHAGALPAEFLFRAATGPCLGRPRARGQPAFRRGLGARHLPPRARPRTARDRDRPAPPSNLAAYAGSWRESAPVQQIASVAEPAHTESETGTATAVAGQAANPDDVDRTPEAPKEAVVEPSSAKAASWMSFIQSLYASAEFRFLR